MKGVTDQLIEIASKRDSGVLARIERLHLETVRGISPSLESEYVARLNILFKDLERTIWAIRILGETTPRIKDYIVSYGERMSALLMEAALREAGVQSRWMTGGEAGIITTDDYGEAKVLIDESRRLVNTRLLQLVEKNIVPVVTGFIGETPRGDTTTLGRGGSDYSAALIGALIGAGEVRLYTNVEGVLTGNPDRVPGARTIPRLAVEEAMELSYLGAKKFHPRTFEPLKLNSIPIRILSFHNPTGESTVVEGSCDGDGGVKAVHVMDGLALVKVRGPTMAGRIGTATEVMSLARDARVNISAIAQPVSETVITLVVKEADAWKLRELALEKLKPVGVVEEAEVESDASGLAVVGCGLSRVQGLSRIMTRLDGYDVKLLARGIRGSSVTVILPSGEAWDAALRIHDEVILGGQG